jgi:hydroxymethylpyrimidine pyrophosphatase-like HAD family hydrolase
MIKAIILDIDGVIIGGRPGYNFPLPHAEVLNSMRQLRNTGIVISLCTARPAFAIGELINIAHLESAHVTFGGAIVEDHASGMILVKHAIGTEVAKNLVSEFIRHGIYVEAYAKDEYAIEGFSSQGLTDVNIKILQKKPTVVDSLASYIRETEIIKIMPAAFTQGDKILITDIVSHFSDVTLQWGANPMYAPTLFGVITARGITKKSGVQTVLELYGIGYPDVLGIGDGFSDWDFMEDCGYIATVENADNLLKSNVSDRKLNAFTGPSVEENGFVTIVNHFF